VDARGEAQDPHRRVDCGDCSCCKSSWGGEQAVVRRRNGNKRFMDGLGGGGRLFEVKCGRGDAQNVG